MNAIAKTTGADLVERVVIHGDLGKLTVEERTAYYFRVCESAGLNPLTKPFEYITLNSKLTLYALRACTDQLRSIHKVSVEDLTESERDGVFIVTAKVKNVDGRTDMAKGAVNIANLKGEALANAMMKAETKAKRRATLSLCGLGFLDETEVETIPDAKIGQPAAETPKQIRAPNPSQPTAISAYPSPQAIAAEGSRASWVQSFNTAIAGSKNAAELHAWKNLNQKALDDIKEHAPKLFSDIDANFKSIASKFAPPKPTSEKPVADFDLESPSTWADNPDPLLKAIEAKCKTYSDQPDPGGLGDWFYENVESHMADAGVLKPDADAIKEIYQRHVKLCGA